MAAQKDPHVAIIAIKPYFAEKILVGEKRAEFRKTRIRQTVSHAIMYATSPRKEIVGYFDIDGFDEGSPLAIWRRYNRIGAIRKDDFWNYFDSCNRGFVIRIGRAYTMDPPLPLRKILNSGVIPQSFCYIDEKTMNDLHNWSRSRVRHRNL